MIKGGNRRMFRKPGLARQAIGILASSKELMDAAQGGQMPMQPVQSFAPGGFVQSQPMSNYLFDALGVVPPGFTRVGKGDDATLQSVPGFSGAYQRLSGIADPARARQQSGMDLLELGARIAAGQSTSATENIAAGLIPTLEGIDKRRQQELANTLAIAQLEDTRKKRQEAAEQAVISNRITLASKMLKPLQAFGVGVDAGTGMFTYDGNSYSTVDQIPLPKDKMADLQRILTDVNDPTEIESLTSVVLDKSVPFQTAMVGVDNFYSAKKIERRERQKVIERQAIAAANARDLIVIAPGSGGYLENAPETGPQPTAQFKDAQGVMYDIFGQIIDMPK